MTKCDYSVMDGCDDDAPTSHRKRVNGHSQAYDGKADLTFRGDIRSNRKIGVFGHLDNAAKYSSPPVKRVRTTLLRLLPDF